MEQAARTEVTPVLALVVPADTLDHHLIQDLIPKVITAVVLARALREPVMVVFESSGPAPHARSRAPTRGICDGTLHSHKRRPAV